LGIDTGDCFVVILSVYYISLSAAQSVCTDVFKKVRELGELCLGDLSAEPTELTLGSTIMIVSYNVCERQEFTL